MTDQLSVQDVAALKESEVYERLGAALLRAEPGTDDRARAFGEQWFSWKLPEMGQRLRDADAPDRLGDEPDPAAVADLLSRMGDATTVACAAVLVVRRGLEEVCEEDDDD
ncbi:hypothetical protein [Pseudonocardia endophytica]|uniref:Uncharacterized protein n=1 Tax=Pseudonocardia endophytica TaxID=401976 RepID=A0A4R1HQ62_PSEEN|nr:hypothetical protein [Pseudonocardia endophytica]TCK24714.1 hypothetical protein EV378_0504 [Pseudonocardia endophytica]